MPRSRAQLARKPAPASDHWSRWLAALFVLALAWKLFCLVRFTRSPLFGDLESDSGTYWAWARKLVVDGWLGKEPFFLGPLYPYLLSLLRPGPNASILVPLAIQCVLGATATVLVAACARTLCPPRYALVAGGLAAGYAMATFMDLAILTESLLWLLEAGVLWLQLSPHASRRPGRVAALSGLAIGLISLGRPSGLLLLLPVAAGAALRRGWRTALRPFAIASACAIGICVPVLARHLALGHGWILTTYSLGYNLYVGNGPGSTGAYVADVDEGSGTRYELGGLEGGTGGDGRGFLARTRGLQLTATQSSAYWLKQALATVTAAPGRALRLFAWKGALALNHDEASQLDDIHVHERVDGPLGLPGLGGFGAIGVMGLIGLAAAWRQREGKVLAAFALVLWAPMVVFFVTDRYRYHLTLPLLVACGPALSAGVETLRVRTPAKLAAGALTALAAIAAVWLPLVQFEQAQVDFATHHELGKALIRRHRNAEGERELERCLEPEMLARLPLARSRASRAAVAGVLQSLAGSYGDRGDYAQSERFLRQALQFSPLDRDLRRDHAVVSAMGGMGDVARAECDTLGLAPSQLARDLVGVAERASEVDSADQVERALRAAIAVDSTSEAANVVLLRMLRGQGRAPEAQAQLARMRARGMSEEVLRRESGEASAR